MRAKLRIPGWARGATATVNDAPVAMATDRGYLSVDRHWRPDDIVTLDLPMPPERIYAHPAVAADVGRVALRRGPLVYCVEEADNASGPVQMLRLPRARGLAQGNRADLLGGIVVVTAEASRVDDATWEDTLYRPAPPAQVPARLVAVPYYLWSNRGTGTMTVWLPEVE
jgi:DUF1680 family protein